MSSERLGDRNPLDPERFISNHGLRLSEEGRKLRLIIYGEQSIAIHHDPNNNGAVSPKLRRSWSARATNYRRGLGLLGVSLEELKQIYAEIETLLEEN